MIDHVSLGSTRYADAVAFYRRVLAPIGLELQRENGAEAAFGTATKWSFFVYPTASGAAVPGSGMHLAFAAPSRDAVAAAHAAAIAAAGSDLFSPRERPDIGAGYFGAMFTDLDGHRIEIKCDG